MWRRSYDVNPPMLNKDDSRNPANQKMYSNISESELPLSESLKDCVNRVVPYFNKEIKPLIKEGKSVLIVAHGNSLRALIKYLKDISDEDIVDLNIPTGVPSVLELDDDLKVVMNYFLGDQEKIAQKVNSVALQASIKK